MRNSGAALLEGKQLLGSEGFVVDLAGGLDQVLQVGLGEEVAEVDELAVVLIFDVDDAPFVLSATDGATVDVNSLVATDDGEGNEVLVSVSDMSVFLFVTGEYYLDLLIDGGLLVVVLFVLVGVEADVVESKLVSDPVLESLALLESQGIGLCNDGDDVDNLAQLLQDDYVDGLESVTCGLDEVETAVDAGILDVAIALSGELLAQVGGVLVLDVLDDGVPASVVVDQVAISGSVDNVQAQTNTVLLNDVGDGVDFCGGAGLLVGGETTLGVDQVRGEDGVDEGRLAQTSLTNTDDIELEAALEELLLDLLGDAVETDVAFGEDGGCLLRGCSGGGHCGCAGASVGTRKLERGKEGRFDDGDKDCKTGVTEENSKSLWYTPRPVWGTGSVCGSERGSCHARPPAPLSPRMSFPSLLCRRSFRHVSSLVSARLLLHP